jgi:hypothetical protein
MCITRPLLLLCRRLAKSLESSSYTFCALCCFVSCAACGLAGFNVFSGGSVAPDSHLRASQALSDAASCAGITTFQPSLPRCPHTSSMCTRVFPAYTSQWLKSFVVVLLFLSPLQPPPTKLANSVNFSTCNFFFFLILVPPPRSYLKDVGIQHSLVPSLGD